tara:strand:+ start:537 stop:1625 length:1089 start_codon:yes stop_codon:yes gene_type:complete
MKLIFLFIKSKKLYNFFLLLALLNIFFSTDNIYAKTFKVNDIEISSPFEINFNKNEIIDRGFVKAFNELIFSIIQSKDYNKIKNTSLKQIKSMIETFSLKEEKFINEVYFLNLNVSFNKKKIFNFLETKNIFPSIPKKKNVLFIPVYVDVNNNEVLLFSENKLFNNWNLNRKKFDLLNYVLPTQDLEDFNLIKRNIRNLESYDFKDIINKYNIDDHIIMIIFKNKKKIRVFNKIYFNKRNNLKNFNFNEIEFNNIKEVNDFINFHKLVYEDFWKSQNEINTSVKLSLNISIDNTNNIKINKFEEILSDMDLIYNFHIYKFDNRNNFYKIIFNGSPDKFLEVMSYKNYRLEIKNKIWVIDERS